MEALLEWMPNADPAGVTGIRIAIGKRENAWAAFLVMVALAMLKQPRLKG